MIQLVCPFCGCFSDKLNAPRTFMCPKCSKNVEYIEPVVVKEIKKFKKVEQTYDVDETLDDIVEGE